MARKWSAPDGRAKPYQNMQKVQSSQFRARSGFSLIEVVLAMGIMVFSAVSMLGLLQVGMNASQQSADVTVGSRLAAEAQAQLQEVGLSGSNAITSFDIDGLAAGSSNPPIYDVYQTVLPCSLPGMTGSNSLTRVIVQVCKNPGHVTLTRDANTGLVVIPVSVKAHYYEFHVASQ